MLRSAITPWADRDDGQLNEALNVPEDLSMQEMLPVPADWQPWTYHQEGLFTAWDAAADWESCQKKYNRAFISVLTDVKHGWNTLRKAAGVPCRLHDLRHTFATRLAENGVPESTMLALMGHMSRAMLERYSHIRMAAKVQAVAGLTLSQNRELVPLKVPLRENTTKVQ